MGKKRAHISVAAYYVPSAAPAVKPRGVSKAFAAKGAAQQRKLDPKQRARLAAAAKKGGKGGKGKGKGKKGGKR